MAYLCKPPPRHGTVEHTHGQPVCFKLQIDAVQFHFGVVVS